MDRGQWMFSNRDQILRVPHSRPPFGLEWGCRIARLEISGSTRNHPLNTTPERGTRSRPPGGILFFPAQHATSHLQTGSDRSGALLRFGVLRAGRRCFGGKLSEGRCVPDVCFSPAVCRWPFSESLESSHHLLPRSSGCVLCVVHEPTLDAGITSRCRNSSGTLSSSPVSAAATTPLFLNP